MARSVKSRTDKTEPPGTTELSADRVADFDLSTNASPDLPGADAEPSAQFDPDIGMQPESDLPPPLEPVQDSLPEPEPTPEPREPERAVLPEKTLQKIGFAPLVFGGIVAAALGYAAAYFGQIDQSVDLTPQIAAQSDRISALEAQLAALPAPPDLAPLTAAISNMQAGLESGQTETATTLAGLATRLEGLEKAPNSDGTLSATAIVAWQQELADLRDQIANQQAQLQALAETTTNQLDVVRADAASIEADATEAAGYVLARAALTRIQAALDAGTSFDAALAEFVEAAPANNGTPGADSLRAMAADGVPTLTALQVDFPDAARAALAVARSEGLAGEEGGGIAAFLRNQFDVRSVIPQEGATADAILSRAEDDLRQNRLSDALAEVASLPEVVRAEMSGWISAAETRIAALAAVEGLSEILTQN